MRLALAGRFSDLEPQYSRAYHFETSSLCEKVNERLGTGLQPKDVCILTATDIHRHSEDRDRVFERVQSVD